MKTQPKRNAILALIGLAALSVYILACTSFSPDDTKVLYPSFDAGGGAIGMAVYDRTTHRSEMLFTPVSYAADLTNGFAPVLIRGQWLGEGRNVVLGWAWDKNEDQLNVGVVPATGRGPTRLYRVPDVRDSMMRLQWPLCVAGERLLFMGDRNTVGRLDLRTGSLVARELPGTNSDFTLLPSPDGAAVFYVASGPRGSDAVFGKIDPDTFRTTPLLTLTNDLGEGSFFAYDPRGLAVAFVQKTGDASRLVALRQGKPPFERPLGVPGEKWIFGNGGFFPAGDKVWATCQKPSGTNSVACSLIEIPLSDAPVRETILIPDIGSGSEESAAYFQASLSHDGKTAAVASTFLACALDDFKPQDCALFLIDLGSPDRKVTRIAIPFTANHPKFK
jgi:hypothetical protein